MPEMQTNPPTGKSVPSCPQCVAAGDNHEIQYLYTSPSGSVSADPATHYFSCCSGHVFTTSE